MQQHYFAHLQKYEEHKRRMKKNSKASMLYEFHYVANSISELETEVFELKVAGFQFDFQKEL